jgi:hypothetical protein
LIVCHMLSNTRFAELRSNTHRHARRAKVCTGITPRGGGVKSKFAVLRGNFTGESTGLSLHHSHHLVKTNTRLRIAPTGKSCQSASGIQQGLCSLIDRYTHVCSFNDNLTGTSRVWRNIPAIRGIICDILISF